MMENVSSVLSLLKNETVSRTSKYITLIRKLVTTQQTSWVVCPNCHAQLEQATVSDLRWAGGWLVGVTINGKRISVRQPLAHESYWKALLSVTMIIATMRVGRFLVR